MKKKILWLVVSGLMVLSLVMAACAPAAVEEEKEEVIVEEEKEEEEVVAPTVEKPKYGGVLKVGLEGDIVDFDEIVGNPFSAKTEQVTNETLWTGDWARGAAGGYGTNEAAWTGKTDVWELYAGAIAESWELPSKIEGETCTVIYHIRKGIHWALNPVNPRPAERLVGGRELTADDVVFSLEQAIFDIRARIGKTDPTIRQSKITSPEPWIVKVEFPWESFEMAISRFGGSVNIVPPEVVQQLGDMNDWKRSVGTGPFMLTDFVPGSTATMVRNPNYWNKDPIGPGKGNQLPYLDGVKYLLILDKSTLFAALRTAKIDWTGGDWSTITRDDVASLKQITPQLMSRAMSVYSGRGCIAMKLDRAPFNDIRVRRALMMAIDFETIKRDLFGGDAQIITFPICYVKEYADAYLGLDDPECPASVKELYTYNPEKARALLAEAGYPQGFKTSLIIESPPEDIDYYSIYKDMWAKVGVEVELLPKEVGAWNTIKNKKSWDQMISVITSSTQHLFKMQYMSGPGLLNASDINDPVVNEAKGKVITALVADRAEAMRLHKELMKYVLDQAWAIPRVISPFYSLWWPWLKNYSGESHFATVETTFFDWVWLDQELKKSMGY